MAQYRVNVEEIHIVTLFVEADSEDEAREKANDMIEDGAPDGEYSYTTAPDVWNVQKMGKDGMIAQR